MEQTFQLKQHGKLSLWEQNQMSAEDRGWYLKRLYQHFEEEKQRAEAQSGKSTPARVGKP